jgi:signal transduction histidine kinase
MVSERSQLDIVVETHGDEHQLTSESKMAVFRIAQEAIMNVVKHADAKKVEVDLTYTDEGMGLTVKDDGCGFDLPRIQLRRDNWGLLGMHERASLMGGEFKIMSEPGMGTFIEIHIPYHTVEEDHNGNSIIVGG